MRSQSIIGITMGDPAGIGPEIALKALLSDRILRDCTPVVIGDESVIAQTVAMMGVGCTYTPIHKIDSACSGMVNVLSIDAVNPDQFHIGTPSAITGRASFQ